MLPLVHAVIINWNGREQLLECLGSLEKLDYPASRFLITVVDNASTDGSQTAVLEKFPNVALLENSVNLGYVAAVNRGAEKQLEPQPDYIWIFNNDVIVYPNTLQNLIKVAEKDPNIGIVGPIIYDYEDTSRIRHSGYKVNRWTGRLRKLRFGVDVFDDGCTEEEVDSILGCSNLIKAKTWSDIGPLDPIYRLYFEETDFNMRARQKGWRVVLVRNAGVRHKGSATMNKYLSHRAWLLLRNLFIFHRRNTRWYHQIIFIPYFFLVHVPYFLIRGLFYGLSVKIRQRP